MININKIAKKITSSYDIAARGLMAKGKYGKIRQHAKKHGQDVANEVMSELSSVLDKSGWKDDEKKHYRETVIEEIVLRLEKLK